MINFYLSIFEIRSCVEPVLKLNTLWDSHNINFKQTHLKVEIMMMGCERWMQQVPHYIDHIGCPNSLHQWKRRKTGIVLHLYSTSSFCCTCPQRATKYVCTVTSAAVHKHEYCAGALMPFYQMSQLHIPEYHNLNTEH